MLSKDHDGIIIVGKRKQGKSTLTKALYRNERRVMLYDAKGELVEPLALDVGYIHKRIWKDKGIIRAYVTRGAGQPADELEWSAWCAIQMGHCVYVVDELPDALEDGDPPDSFKWVTRMGRRRDVRFIYTFQRAGEVPVMVRTNAADWYLFQTNEKSDIDYLRGSIGKDLSEVVRVLPQHHYLHIRDGREVGVFVTERP